MIVKMIKDAWTNFTAPLRPRPPIPPWTSDLLEPHEKRRIEAQNQAIQRHTQRLERELALIDRDHGRG